MFRLHLLPYHLLARTLKSGNGLLRRLRSLPRNNNTELQFQLDTRRFRKTITHLTLALFQVRNSHHLRQLKRDKTQATHAQAPGEM